VSIKLTMTRLLSILVLLALVGCSTLRPLMPTPNLYADEHEKPFSDLHESLASPDIDLLYMTDRVPVTDDNGKLGYGSGRSASLAFGRATVRVGQDVTWEDLVEASATHERAKSMDLEMGEVVEIARSPPSPMAFDVVDGKVVEDAEALVVRDEIISKFHQEVARRLSLTPRKDVYVYVHGYHNTFEDGAFAMGELWHFFGREGVPISYSWPAGFPGIFGYTYDRESSEFTVGHLKRSLQTLASFPEVERIHLIAHSRGTDVATAALRELTLVLRASGQDPKKVLKLHNLILAAPDIDVEVAEQRLMAEKLGLSAERTTIYTSPADKAIGIAAWLFESPRGRIGTMGESSLSAQDKKYLENIPTNLTIVRFEGDKEGGGFGHSYFRNNPSVSSDIVLLLRYDRQPGTPSRPLKPLGLHFWEVPADYPTTAVIQ